MTEDRELPVEVQNMIAKMQEQLIRRFSNIEENLIIVELTLLDPRFKKSYKAVLPYVEKRPVHY
jgi:hypothetical protein